MNDKLPAQQSNPSHAPEHTKTDPTQAAVTFLTTAYTRFLDESQTTCRSNPFCCFFCLKDPFVRTSKAKRTGHQVPLESLADFVVSQKRSSGRDRLQSQTRLSKTKEQKDEYVEDDILPRPKCPWTHPCALCIEENSRCPSLQADLRLIISALSLPQPCSMTKSKRAWQNPRPTVDSFCCCSGENCHAFFLWQLLSFSPHTSMLLGTFQNIPWVLLPRDFFCCWAGTVFRWTCLDYTRFNNGSPLSLTTWT